eukprot:5514295-Prymnesium_polylepis.1
MHRLRVPDNHCDHDGSALLLLRPPIRSRHSLATVNGADEPPLSASVPVRGRATRLTRGRD